MLWIFALALGVRLAVFAVGLASADAKGHNPAFYWHDSGQYLIPAASLFHHGTYTMEIDNKQVPYYFRPPAYPFFIVACYAIGGERTAAILLPQLVLGALACCLTYWLTAMLVNHRAGLITGALMSLDQILIAYSNKVMAETFSIVFLVGSSLLLLQFLARKRQVLLWLSAIAVGISTLAHGSTLYYPIVPLTLIALWKAFSLKERVIYCAVFLLAYLITIGTWQMRNLTVFGVYQVVPVTHTLVQTAARVMSAAPPYRPYAELATECHRRVEELFCHRHGLDRLDWSNKEFRTRHFGDFLRTERQLAFQLLREHMPAFAGEATKSFLQMTLFPLPYAEICRFGQAQRLDDKEKNLRATMLRAVQGLFHRKFREFGEEVRQIPFCKLFGFGWNALYWLLSIPAALWGSWLLIRKRLWWQSLFLLGTIAYFAVTNSIVQAGDGMQRYRLRILPYLYCVAAVGWVNWSTVRRGTSEARASVAD